MPARYSPSGEVVLDLRLTVRDNSIGVIIWCAESRLSKALRYGIS